ncbi:MAG: FAD-dependent oxidoreductase [Patescibacteria group bacterium]
MYDLIIVGGGPAGVSAGVYAARKRLKTLLITESFGGQSVESVGVENWIGTIKISGPELAKVLEEHLRAYAGDSVSIKTGARVEKIKKTNEGFEVNVGSENFKTKTVLIASGSSRRKLDIPGAKKFENKGITYCASCDGPLFSDQDTVVIGGGNAGLETAAQLMAYTKSVTILIRGDSTKADQATVERILANPKVREITNATPVEIRGDKFVKSILYKNSKTGEEEEIMATGIFVEIGLIPATNFVEELVSMNNFKQIKIDPRTQRTETKGIWAAGDATDSLYHQNNIASGDAVRALEDIYLYIQTGK